MCKKKAVSTSRIASVECKQPSRMIRLVAVFLLVLSVCDAKVLTDTCTTADSKEGLCVKLQECPSIFAMSNDLDTPLTIERLNFLIDSQCGYVGNNPKVCCSTHEMRTKNVMLDKIEKSLKKRNQI